jgi:hypothetical protein
MLDKDPSDALRRTGLRMIFGLEDDKSVPTIEIGVRRGCMIDKHSTSLPSYHVCVGVSCRASTFAGYYNEHYSVQFLVAYGAGPWKQLIT